MIRIQAIHFIVRLAPELQKDVFNKQFMDVILQLAEDPVPNIRFNVSKCISQFYGKMTPGNKFKCESAIKKMVKDTDFDS
jgi:serine/threonine-protein phosphatase 2A regulatory subunit A